MEAISLDSPPETTATKRTIRRRRIFAVLLLLALLLIVILVPSLVLTQNKSIPPAQLTSSTSQPTSQPTSKPTSQPTSPTPPTLSPTTAQPTTVSPTTLSPTMGPTTNSPTTTFPTASPTIDPCHVLLSYRYNGTCNRHNNRALNLVPSPSSTLASPANLSNVLFGAAANVDRGRSKLTVLAIAYARFFLFDVLEVLEGDMTLAPLDGCTAGFYGKLKDGARNFQTPVMDLSNVFGNSDAANAILKSNASYLKFNRVGDDPRNLDLGYGMISEPNASVFVSGSPNSNVDHFSVYIHSRFFHLHSKFVTMLQDGHSSALAVFESARLFVVMVAETIARDLAMELGTLPVDYDCTQGIPPEFLLMPFMDRFPDVLPTYGDVPNRTDDSLLCTTQPSRNYNTTLYNTTDLISNDTNADDLSWVGYAGMYTSGRNGGVLTNRCNNQWYGMLSTSPFDPVAALIQRGRDHQFPSCSFYRTLKGLPTATFTDFGNDEFSRTFARLYSDNFANVDLSVCLLLDADLRDRMMGSLILGVLSLQNSSSYCVGATPTLDGTVVSTLHNTSYFNSAPVPGSNLETIANAVCRGSPKLDLRALSMIDQLALNASNSALINLGSFTDRFVVCTTADPFLSPHLKYKPSRSIIKEGDLANCDWNFRDPNNNGTSSGLYLSNAPRCFSGFFSDPPPGFNWPTNGQARRCFCAVRDQCFDRGVITTGGFNIVCTCDGGYNRVQFSNTACERMSYPQSPKLYDQFGNNTLSPWPAFQCSAYYPDTIPVPPTNNSEIAVTGGYLNGVLQSYCTNSRCDNTEGPYLTGACNQDDADAGRVGAKLDRIVKANYPNGKFYTVDPSANWTSAFYAKYPPDSSTIPQNALFRGMAKMLLGETFKASATYFNESELRTGTDASNPAQFMNTQTEWLDLSTVFSIPGPYATTPRFNSGTHYDLLSGNLYSFNPTGITDYDEYMMMTIFYGRYTLTYNRLSNAQPFASPSVGVPVINLSTCVRALTILEYQKVAVEFLTEAKSMNLTANWTNATFPATPNVPVEIGAARLFDLHLGHNFLPNCSSFTYYDRSNVSKCITDASLTPLQRQIVPNGTTINDAVNLANTLGIGSLNAYLNKLGNLSENLHSANNILFDLHGSSAEYALNFGILESILGQDKKQGDASAKQVCLDAIQYSNPSVQTSWLTLLNNTMNSIASTSLCKLLLEAANTNTANGMAPQLIPYLHPGMFKVAPGTGAC